MSTALLIYLYLSLGSLLTAAGIVVGVASVVLGITGIFIVVGWFCEEVKPSSLLKIKPYLKIYLWVAGLTLLLSSFYPDKEDLAWIIGGSVAVSVASSEEAQKLPDNVLRAVNQFLEDVPDKEPEQE